MMVAVTTSMTRWTRRRCSSGSYCQPDHSFASSYNSKATYMTIFLTLIDYLVHWEGEGGNTTDKLSQRHMVPCFSQAQPCPFVYIVNHSLVGLPCDIFPQLYSEGWCLPWLLSLCLPWLLSLSPHVPTILIDDNSTVRETSIAPNPWKPEHGCA